MTPHGLTIFVIDDDPSVRRAIDRLLRAEGYTVETYASGEEFLDSLDERRAGCIVLDVRMPGLSGFEILECLAARHSRLPVILITGHGDTMMGWRAMAVGCAAFLAKPFECDALVGAVRDALSGESAGPATGAPV